MLLYNYPQITPKSWWLVGRRIFVSRFAFGCVVIVVCLSWLLWLVISALGYVDILARLLEIKRGLSRLPSFSDLTQLIKKTYKTHSNSCSHTNTTNNIVSRSIYNPKHYIDEYRNPERRPLESFHKVILPLSPIPLPSEKVVTPVVSAKNMDYGRGEEDGNSTPTRRRCRSLGAVVV